MGCKHTGIVGDRFMCAGGTTNRHSHSRPITDPASSQIQPKTPKLRFSIILSSHTSLSGHSPTSTSSINQTDLQEPLVQGVFSDVQHLGAVDAAVIIHLLDVQPVREGRDVQHVEQRGLAGAHLVSRFDQLNVALWTRHFV